MAAPLARVSVWPVTGRTLSTAAALCRRAAPLGPFPNDQFRDKDLDSLKKYRSFNRYYRQADKESKKTGNWWRSYRQFLYPTKVLIPLDEVRSEWEVTWGPNHIQRVAEHYGVFKDLFGEAMFVPRVPLRIHYNTGEDAVMPVYYGNVVTPTEAAAAPMVSFEAEEGSLWTLLLTNPDGHLRETDSEYVHWLVGNIPGNQVLSGDEVCHYFPAFPAKGTGYHRYIYILFKQEGRIDFKDELRPNPCHSLKLRTFKTLDFYRKYEDRITPAGLAFFQCAWDDSVTSVFHNVLNMKEPIFEHQFPPVYHPPQKKFPHLQPLRYLDRYRDSDELTYGIY
ncbi:hypothetical protein GDO81_011265 [Engystomops pustulosus]|uniref:Large ribosomal subunit protein mL38 n=1 Tax=Engystomops pustulosus TaxID=76066 RepID=A0AAV7BD87_ENGPU|nr:hypothetical protein GDO81_011265 [Engystomops pustulosus]